MRDRNRLIDIYRDEIRARLGLGHASSLDEDDLIAFQTAALTTVAELACERSGFPAGGRDIQRLVEAMCEGIARGAAVLAMERVRKEVLS